MIQPTNEVFQDYRDLFLSRTTNGLVDLRGVKITEKQLEEFVDYIYSIKVFRLIFKGLYKEGIFIVENEKDSSFVSK